MTQYACFLRGINVGGIRFSMADLKTCLFEIGLRDSKTYLQSGNVTFSSDIPASELKSMIEAALSKRFAYNANVILYQTAELQAIIDEFPFVHEPTLHRYAVLVSDINLIAELMTHQSQLDPTIERIAASKNVLYWQLPKGQSTDTIFSKLMAKAKFRTQTTVRNLNTLEKMTA